MINFVAVDFSKRRPEEVISFFWRSVYIYLFSLPVLLDPPGWTKSLLQPEQHPRWSCIQLHVWSAHQDQTCEVVKIAFHTYQWTRQIHWKSGTGIIMCIVFALCDCSLCLYHWGIYVYLHKCKEFVHPRAVQDHSLQLWTWQWVHRLIIYNSFKIYSKKDMENWQGGGGGGLWLWIPLEACTILSNFNPLPVWMIFSFVL